MNNFIPLIKKETLEDFLTARGVFSLIVASVVLSAFSILLVSNTELSLLDNAQAVYLMVSIILALASLVAIIQGSDGFAGERDRATLETLMLTPMTGQGLAAAKLTAMLFSWLILFVLSIPYLWAVGTTGQNLWAAVEYLSLTGTLLVLIFGGLALTLSAKVKSFRGVLSIGLTVFLFSGSPVLLGPALRQSAVGQMIDLINPFADALNTLDSVVIDSQEISFQVIRLTIMICYVLGVLGVLYTATKRVEL
jgi:ABC-type transport system involved in multi-copper enzyme maturation permease subunit